MLRKIFIIFLIILLTLPTQLFQVIAVTYGDKVNIERHHWGFYSIQFQKDNGSWSYVTYNRVTYTDENGIERVAYCVEPELPGPGWVGEGIENYDVLLTETLSNVKLWRVYINGYPYKTPEQMGCETADDAYLATKQAAYWVLKNKPLDQIKTYFRPGQSVIENQNLAETKRRGQKVINAIYDMVNAAYNGTQTPANSDVITISKVGSFAQDSSNSNYYSQTYKPTASVDMSTYTVRSIENFPSGSFVASTNGTAKTTFNSGESFKIMVPKSNITKDLTGTVYLIGKCKTYPVYYAESTVNGYQDHAICCDPYGDITEKATLSIDGTTSTITVNKTDAETGGKISGVTFGLYNSNGTQVASSKTNSEGIATFSNISQGTYTVKEISVPENYILNSQVFTISVGYQSSASLNVTNYHKKGNIKINKTDSETSTPIEGVTFQLINSSGSVVQTGTTNSKGELSFNNVRIGNYKLKETATHKNYVLNTTEFDVKVEYNKTTTKNITNTFKKGHIKINKTDAETSEAIEGVTFQLSKKDGTVIGTATTNSKGEANFSNIRIGDYILKETSTHKNYILNTATFEVNVEYNKTTTKNITNEIKRGHLQINKTDDETKEPVQGVTFQLIDSKGTVVKTGVTDANGKLKFTDLRIGKYTLKETATHKNYILNTTVFDVEIEYEKTTVKDIENEHKKGHIQISKIDAETKKGIEGVTFGLYKSDGTQVATATTNANGIANFKNIRIGNYILKELSTNENYILNTAEFDVKVEYNITTKTTIENEHKRGDLKIYKVDKDNNRVTLGNVIFDLYSEEFDEIIGTYTTNVDGEIIIQNLRIGNYKLIETLTGKWYDLADDTEVKINWNEMTHTTIENELKKGSIKVIKVDKDNNEVKIPGVVFQVLDENNNILETIVTNEEGIATTKRYAVRDFENLKLREIRTDKYYVLNTEIKTIELKANEISSVTFENEKKKGQIKVIKVDLDNNEVVIPNVEFEVYDESGNIVDKLVTDSNGEAISRKLPIDEEYTVKETKTDEIYVLNEETKIVTLEYNQISNLTFTNEKKKGQIEVVKIDKDNNEVFLEGVTFEILDSNNNIVDTIVTDTNGKAISKRLPIDEEYIIKETITKEEYVLSEETQKVTLKQEEITSLTFENEKKKGQVRVIKVDLDNNEVLLEGVTFDILDEENAVVDTIVTDKNGEAISTLLPIDQKYIVVEKETLKNYVLTEETKTIELKQNEITSVTFENEKKKGQIEVIKVDLDNNEVLLEGVTFEILDSNKNIVDTIVTDTNGKAISKRLPTDEIYTVRETITKSEYVLTEEAQTVELKQDEITSITFENEKIKGYVEVTKIDSNTKLPLENTVFGIYNFNNELLQEITTNKDGKATSTLLPIGKYYLKELKTGSPYFLLNENTYEFEIVKNHETVPVTVENDAIDIKVEVEKKGTIETKPGEIVDYSFSNIANKSNVFLDTFGWIDYIPTAFIRLESMTTGTWNQDLKYNVFYKTNKSEDYIIFKSNLSTNENYSLDFTTIKLAEDEYITETYFDFGKVDVGFKESTSPTMKCKSLDTLIDGQSFINYTKTVGTYYDLLVDYVSNWPTIVHVPEEPKPTLPRTGFFK